MAGALAARGAAGGTGGGVAGEEEEPPSPKRRRRMPKLPAKGRKRWPPAMREFKKMVAVVAAETPSSSVTDVFHAVRRRCPEWAVTPHRVRKALLALRTSRNRNRKPNGSGARSSSESLVRVFPHDVVELRASAGRARHAQWQWRGQVLRVAGYDDGESTDDDGELPVGHCSVFWLGHGLEQWPNALTKETALRVVDRPWVLGDRVARSDDPRSLGTVVGVRCSLRLSGVPGPTPLSLEVPVQLVKAVGGFRAEDWVANEATRWVGHVEEAVFRVEVELCGKSDQRIPRGRGRHRPPVCVFQVSSEGLMGLEPAGGEDVTPQELSPHFPGQRVRAPARLWRQAEWLHGSLGRRSPRRGASICGVVSSVECCLLAVRWLAGRGSPQPPDEWVSPEVVRTLGVPNSSEGWAIGDHVQSTPDWHSPSAVVVESRSVVDVRWADGGVEENVPSLKLCPRPHISAHDFLPGDFIGRTREDAFTAPQVNVANDAYTHEATPAAPPANRTPEGEPQALDQESSSFRARALAENANQNDAGAYAEYAPEAEAAAAAARAEAEILPTEGPPAPQQADAPLGMVTSVNLQARTAVVQWGASGSGPSEQEEVSVFELTDHPQVDLRLGDAVLTPDSTESRWAGRVCALGADGRALVELLDGTSHWFDVRRLVVVDDGEESEGSASGDGGSEAEGARTRSDDGDASDVSEPGGTTWVHDLEPGEDDYDHPPGDRDWADEEPQEAEAGADGRMALARDGAEPDAPRDAAADAAPAAAAVPRRALVAAVVAHAARAAAATASAWGAASAGTHPACIAATLKALPGRSVFPHAVPKASFIGLAPVTPPRSGMSVPAPPPDAAGPWKGAKGGREVRGRSVPPAKATPERPPPPWALAGFDRGGGGASSSGFGSAGASDGDVAPAAATAAETPVAAPAAAPGAASALAGVAAAAAEAEAAAAPSPPAAAAPPALPPPAPPTVCPFDVYDEDVEPTDHYFTQHATPPGTRAMMMAVRREMVVLRKGLLEGSEGVPAPIVVRTFSSRSDLFRAMVVGPPETPYAHVPFFFDFALPAEYPREPPLTHFHAHLVGNERLNPNLYVDGKVCLSLLGTWSGPSWDPQRSTLLQVLVSVQGLVFVEEPYFNEPGHECDVGTEQGRQGSALYNEHARLLALRAALNVAQSPPLGFRDIVSDFFSRFGPKLVQECEEALQEPRVSQSSEGFRKVLAKTLLPRLRERWGPRAAGVLEGASRAACSGGPSPAAAGGATAAPLAPAAPPPAPGASLAAASSASSGVPSAAASSWWS